MEGNCTYLGISANSCFSNIKKVDALAMTFVPDNVKQEHYSVDSFLGAELADSDKVERNPTFSTYLPAIEDPRLRAWGLVTRYEPHTPDSGPDPPTPSRLPPRYLQPALLYHPLHCTMDTLVTFDLEAAGNADGRRKQNAKRRKYTARAWYASS